MFRQTLVGTLLTTVIGLGLLAGCDAAGGGTWTPTESHDGQSATGHAGKMPAGGPRSPEGKAAARKAGSVRSS